MQGEEKIAAAGEGGCAGSMSKRRKSSVVWEMMKKFTDERGDVKAACQRCKHIFDGSGKKGTTHLKNHLESKKCRAAAGDVLKSIKTVAEKSKPAIDLIGHAFEYLDPTVLNSRKDSILQVYREVKVKLGKFLNELPCRLTLGICWSANDYCILKVHYIDGSWKLQSLMISILGYSDLDYSQEHVSSEAMKQLCIDLKIDLKICSVVYYDYHQGDRTIHEEMNVWFSRLNLLSLPFRGFIPEDGEILMCNLIEVFSSVTRSTVGEGIRSCLQYAYRTPYNQLKLVTAMRNAESLGKRDVYEDEPMFKFSSSLKYLEIAVGLREAFRELEKIDSDFKSINLTEEKWDEATATFQHLKLLLDPDFKSINLSEANARWQHLKLLGEDSNSISLPSHHTLIENLPSLIYINMVLVTQCSKKEHCHVCRDASHEIGDFINLYWTKLYLDSVIVIILDPRFKMDAVQLWYQEIYCSDDADAFFQDLVKDFREVYDEYAENNNAYSKPHNDQMLDAMGRQCSSSAPPQSELDLYLKELKVPAVKKFDILAWWRGNAPFYPILANMARDYLTMPFSLRNGLAVPFVDYIDNYYDPGVDDQISQAVFCLREWSERAN